ncbi:MAG: glycoside hydrolase family 9 protein [Glaciecola sp.]
MQSWLKASVLGAAVLMMTCTTVNVELAHSTKNNAQVLQIQTRAQQVKINQVGYLPSAPKIAVVPNTNATRFELVQTGSSITVYQGQLSEARNWPVAQESVRLANFSNFNLPGTYTLKVQGLPDSMPITISADAYQDIHQGAVKAYYFNRASTALTQKFAGDWQRPQGHLDNHVLVHQSAVDSQRTPGTIIDASKGWYDAGDYNKYVVNSGISVYTLLASYQHNTALYTDLKTHIPESNNTAPDILDEIKWNLDWMLKMQDPVDGGVYHKLTSLNFAAGVMPHQASAKRYVVQKTTAATLNFAAVMAKASVIYGQLDEFSSMSTQYQRAAEFAWQWALANRQVKYTQPSDVRTGEYGDSNFEDEFTWASAELFLLTNNNDYWQEFTHYFAKPRVPSWRQTAALAYISLLTHHQNVLSKADYIKVKSRFIGLADTLLTQHHQSAYATAMTSQDFVWGSNSVALNKAMILLVAHKVINKPAYEVAAIGLLDYVLGKNPLDLTYVTGFGYLSPQHPHHRQSYADDISAPVPGFLVGGPHSGQQDKCDYKSTLPALSYVDSWCSYATNEVTINWNAPLVYTLGTLLQQRP